MSEQSYNGLREAWRDCADCVHDRVFSGNEPCRACIDDPSRPAWEAKTVKSCTCHDCRLQARREKLEALVTEREGMVAENRLWIEEFGGANRQPYREDAFRDFAAKMRALGEG